MKNLHKIILSAFAGLFMLTSCHDITTDNVTKVTYYPVINLIGGDVVGQKKGEAYVDPYTATLRGANYTDSIQVTGVVDTGTQGVYFRHYSFTNKDGFVTTATRMVIVVPSVIAALPDLSGDYSMTVSRNGVTAASMPYPQPFAGKLTKIFGDTYYISDLISGWYQARFSVSNAALVPRVSCLGIISIVGTEVKLIKAYADNYWGTTPTPTGDSDVIGSYNPATGVITIATLWSGYTFSGVYTPIAD